MELQEAKRAVLEGVRRLVASALVARTWGNISCRVDASHFVITPSGREYEQLTEDQLVLVRLDDLSWEGPIKPSSEKGIHAAVYRRRTDVGYVIHTHQEMASLASQLGCTIPVPHIHQPLLGTTITTARYALPGTKALRGQVERVLDTQPHASLLLARHGALCFGAGMEETYAIADALETVCAQAVFAQAPLLSTFTDPPSVTVLAQKTEAGSTQCSERDLQRLCTALLTGTRGYTHILLVRSGDITACMERISVLNAYLDDFAQIAGPNLRVMKNARSHKALLSAAKGRDALLIAGIGALAMGSSQADATAVATLLQKNCKAALLALSAPAVRPLPLLDTLLMRLVYRHTYSKLATSTK